MREFAIDLARRAGALLLEFHHAATEGQAFDTKSSPVDLVTAADVASDHLISEALAAEFPSHVVFSEESASGPLPAADYVGGRFRLIRPLFYVAESELVRFARACGFPPPPPACPRSGDSRRKLVADMLKLLGRDYLKQARPNLIRAGLGRRPTADQGRPIKDQ